MKRAAETVNANQRATDDWWDYSLDQQKRLGPDTGSVTKHSSACGHRWVNEAGKRLQTNGINANPSDNGRGKWTLQQNVH